MHKSIRIISNLKKPEDVRDEEYKTVEAKEKRGWTGFHRDREGVFIYNYMIKGNLKNSANVLRQQIGIAALKSKVTNSVFVSPRRIRFDLKNADSAEATAEMLATGESKAKIGENGLVILERPLRAETMQGPRVTVVRSDVIPANAKVHCELKVLKGQITEQVLNLLLTYGNEIGLRYCKVFHFTIT